MDNLQIIYCFYICIYKNLIYTNRKETTDFWAFQNKGSQFGTVENDVFSFTLKAHKQNFSLKPEKVRGFTLHKRIIPCSGATSGSSVPALDGFGWETGFLF